MNYQPNVEVLSIFEVAIESVNSIKKLKYQHFLIETEASTADQRERYAGQLLRFSLMQDLPDARAYCLKIVGVLRAATVTTSPVARVVEAGMKNSGEISPT